MDMAAIMTAIMPHMSKHLNTMMEAMRAGQPAPKLSELNTDQINAALAHLPEIPDENLR
jgi:hypothetical protein